MKKKYLYIIGIGLLSVSSCQKDKLYPSSQTSIVSDENYLPFTTPDRIKAQVFGLYNNLRSGNLYGGRFQVYNEVKAENWLNATANSVTAYQTWGGTAQSTSSEVLSLWSQAYFVINNANLFIDGMAAKGTAVVGATLSANYIAEAKFARAISYYALVEMYCKPYGPNAGTSPGLPLRLTGNNSYANFDLAPVTVAKIYDQILADLNDAEAGLPAGYFIGAAADATSNTTRAHKNTAIAFKTRVYLSMQKYTETITEANKIVSGTTSFTAPTGVAFALQANIANVFKTPYTTTESIFSMSFLSTETAGSQSALGNYFNGIGALEFYLSTAGVLADAGWKATDVRKTSLLVTRASGRTYVNKFPVTTYTDWAPVMRYSEVLLNLAEARVRTTNLIDPQAVTLLNAVRNRSDAATTYTVASFASATALITAILQERNIEFLGEGLRWNDLWRLNLPIPGKTAPTGVVPQINPTDAPYIWPMSNSEQQYNKLIGR
jgi:hypothetical protein